MTLELTTRSRRRSARTRRSAVLWASGLLMLTALTFVLPVAVGLSGHTVTDDAMGGTMGKGSAVIVDSESVADLKVGDVITYAAPPAGSSALVTRRIAELDRGFLRTSGDRTGALDPWTVELVGSTQDRVVAHVPYAGYVLEALDGWVRFWLAGCLVLLIAAVSFSGSRAARRDEASAGFTPVSDPQRTGIPRSGTLARIPSPRHEKAARSDAAVGVARRPHGS